MAGPDCSCAVRPRLAVLLGVTLGSAALALASPVPAPAQPPEPVVAGQHDGPAPPEPDPAGGPRAEPVTATGQTTEPPSGCTDLERAAAGDLQAWQRLLRRGPEAARQELRQAIQQAERMLARLRALQAQLEGTARRLSGLVLPSWRAHAERRPPEPVPWYEDKLAEAEGRMAAGDHLGAMHLLEALLVLGPPRQARQRALELRALARERYLRAEVIAADLQVARTLLAPGEPIRLLLELKSHCAEPLRLHGGRGMGSWNGALEVEVLLADPSGSIRRYRVVRALAIQVPETLAEGKPWRTDLVVPLEPDRAPPGVFRRITVRGSLRPEALARGPERLYGSLPLFPVVLRVAEQAHHGLSGSALAAVRAALGELRAAREPAARQAAAERLFYAAVLAPPAERDRVGAALLAALRDPDDPAGPVALTALRVLYDRPELMDREQWLRAAARER
ncbi:MAG: hypothetical protein KatS3mg102_1295 [Planctomycetota bacterium]|nr:MAG: hypothetical protein KatS3mg102_1295 [Planctomycetota bacterium]